MQRASPEDLWIKTCGGDQDAAEQLLFHYGRRLRASLVKRGATRELAEDLAQETFLKLLASASARENAKEYFKITLFRVAKTLFYDRLREIKRRKKEALSVEPTVSSDIEAAVHNSDVRALLRSHIELLSESLRQVMNLYLLDYDPAEIAEELGVQPGTVYTRKSRAIEKLSKSMKEDPAVLSLLSPKEASVK